MLGKELSKALREGRRVYGTCVTSTAPTWPAMIASTGVDLAFIDTEHTPIDRAQLAWMCLAFRTLRVAPIVRIPKPDPFLACMALDGGATGVIVPYVESPAQVHDLRGAVKLRPLKGKRLENVLAGDENLESATQSYLAARNEDRVMIINIESTPALERLEEIISVPELDAVLVGPHDLSISLGVPEQYNHPVFLDAITTIISKCRQQRIGVGIHFSDGIESEIMWARQGANLIMHSSDGALVRQTLAADLARFRKELGDDNEVPVSSREPSNETI